MRLGLADAHDLAQHQPPQRDRRSSGRCRWAGSRCRRWPPGRRCRRRSTPSRTRRATARRSYGLAMIERPRSARASPQVGDGEQQRRGRRARPGGSPSSAASRAQRSARSTTRASSAMRSAQAAKRYAYSSGMPAISTAPAEQREHRVVEQQRAEQEQRDEARAGAGVAVHPAPPATTLSCGQSTLNVGAPASAGGPSDLHPAPRATAGTPAAAGPAAASPGGTPPSACAGSTSFSAYGSMRFA